MQSPKKEELVSKIIERQDIKKKKYKSNSLYSRLPVFLSFQSKCAPIRSGYQCVDYLSPLFFCKHQLHPDSFSDHIVMFSVLNCLISNPEIPISKEFSHQGCSLANSKG